MLPFLSRSSRKSRIRFPLQPNPTPFTNSTTSLSHHPQIIPLPTSYPPVNRLFPSGYFRSPHHKANGFLRILGFVGSRRNLSSEPNRESINYDLIIVGAGPAGLSAAIRFKQLCSEKGVDLSVCVVEKGAEVGAHILSGNVFEPRALDELLPNWKEDEAPIDVPVSSDKFLLLTKNHAFSLPSPFDNEGNYVISLSQLVRWLGSKAEELGVEIFPGFAASEVLYDSSHKVIGIATNDMGVSKNGSRKDNFQRGVELKGVARHFSAMLLGARVVLVRELGMEWGILLSMERVPAPHSGGGNDGNGHTMVLSLINKRLCALRKKQNRITQMEEAVSHGKPINKEQEETLKFKPSVLAAIDELEKLRQPLSAAVTDETQLALERHTPTQNPPTPETLEKQVDDDVIGDLLNLLTGRAAGRVNLLAEGCRGSLSEKIMRKYKLREKGQGQHQTYALGIKEVWEIDADKHKPGSVLHTLGWPLDHKTYGGSFLYHMKDRQVAVGLVVALNYHNPFMNPYEEFQLSSGLDLVASKLDLNQKLKQHPAIKRLLEGGTVLQYGARTLNEGGFQSIPYPVFPGGAVIGCSAGFLNVPKIKGSHTAMKSGMLAAESAFGVLHDNLNMDTYWDSLRNSWIWKELYSARNYRPAFEYGLFPGLALSALEHYLLKGRSPLTLKHGKPDYEATKEARLCSAIEYPKPDGVLSFDVPTSLYRSNTNHDHDQPAHLRLRDPTIPELENLPKYAGLESRYCPARVYEYVPDEKGQLKLQINAQNCLHCKACDIKDPKQNIEWTVPEGGGGPGYSIM
ncbi:hypothetical protein RJ640_021173 [Escallonia rubra]|uniref:Electron transfer flavoprotein-ubiquinone oxidoreductase, mitochondrial n=1 Tax=Escallonia rubra TaxID=112253 RepID=A0AA88U562_9ASTE|nr:hypothetical protein RJ640_021173 [Escallonia rubra]